MPRAKKQKPTENSSPFAQGSDGHSSDAAFESAQPSKTNESSKTKGKNDHKHNADKSKGDEKPRNPYEYVCHQRPLFDIKSENWLKWSDDPDAHVDEQDVVEELCRPIWKKEEEAGILGASPEKHPEHKWVAMWNAQLKIDWLCRKGEYCNPDNFGMYLCNDWRSYGITEILEKMMVEFDNAYRSKGSNRLEEMWVVISAVGFWFNESDHFNFLTMSDDSESVRQLLGVMGSAVLTVLAEIEKAGELKPDSRFLDLAVVIGYYLEFCHDLPAYGFEDEPVEWRTHAIEYFKKANLDPAKALATTKKRMEQIEKGDSEEEQQDGTAKDAEKENTGPQATTGKSQSPEPVTGKRKRDSICAESKADKDANKGEDIWGWNKLFKAYKKSHSPNMGGNHYDITKMTRAERKAAAFDGKDPLADMAPKDLKEDLLDFV